jgi:hypothetical protein
MLYLYQLRKNTAFKARSPTLIFIGVFLIYLDSIGYTFVFSNDDVKDCTTNPDNCKTQWNHKCNLNILVA